VNVYHDQKISEQQKRGVKNPERGERTERKKKLAERRSTPSRTSTKVYSHWFQNYRWENTVLSLSLNSGGG